MATPNNFRITNAIGTTDNFAGAEVQFFHITLITADGSTVLDVRNELGYDETMHNITRTVLQRGTIIYQRIDNGQCHYCTVPYMLRCFTERRVAPTG